MAKFVFHLLIPFLVLLTASQVCQAVMLSNNYIEVFVDNAGQFTMGTTGGDPGNPLDDNKLLLFGHPNPWSSYTTIRINGHDYRQPFWTVFTAPYNSDSSNISVWDIASGIRVTQTLTLVANPITGRTDTVQIKYTVQNTGNVSHSVGVRVMLDTMLGDEDGAPFRVPGTGAVTYETEWDSGNMPPFYIVYDVLINPTVIAMGILRGGLATTPDRFVVCDWTNIFNTGWDFTVDPTKPFDGSDGDRADSALAIWWNPVTIAAGQSKDFVTYYGIGAIDLDFSPPLVTGLSAPFSLTVIDKALSPDPFTLICFVENSAEGVTGTVTGVTLLLNLPTGLELAEGTLLRGLGDIERNASSQTSWKVRATGLLSGTLTYSVTVNSTGGAFPGSKTVSKTIFVPESVTNFAGVAGDGQVSLTWTNLDFANLTWNDLSPTNWAGTLILRRAGNYADTLPTDGTLYRVGDFIGEAIVVYSGSGDYSINPLIDTHLVNDTRYYYTAFTFDSAWSYIPAGAGIFATPVAPDTTPPDNVTNFVARAANGQVTLSWTNPCRILNPDFAGVKIFRSTDTHPVIPGPPAVFIYHGRGTSHIDTHNIIGGTTYFYTAFAHDRVPNYASGTRAKATPRAPLAPDPEVACFIATAVYGTPLAAEVRILARFRDERLLTNEWGRRFVAFYYKHSPQWAEFISGNNPLKTLVKMGLRPLIWLARLTIED